ncbi:MAG: cell envelope biogenesis protein OmpA [Flavobacteriaceae bacterium]|nr:cell envelope biogenesis protein OmpA [Flavobacteriaceae bacterium]
MKYIYIILILVLANSAISAQNKDTQAADKLFKKFEFISAAESYLKLVASNNADGYVYRQLGECYYNIYNTKEAAKWYAKAITKKQNSELYYRYAQMLKANGNYAESNKQMQKFAEMEPNDSRAKIFNENPNYVPILLDQQKYFDVQSIDINSDKSDFGALLMDNTIYFTSARNSNSKIYSWTKEPFLDIYKANLNEDGTISNILLVNQINSKYHDGSISISQDGSTMYFTSDSFRENSFEKDKTNKLKLGRNNIFSAKFVNGKWDEITSLPFNSKDFSTGNPSISNDGKTLYFSSNRPGGIGGVDIWKVAISETGGYGTPENLGKNVNTEGNESFPFITSNDVLYFSSDAKQGLGAMDVYKIDLTKNSGAINLGKPVNSEKDDFAFTINENKKIGFVASNRNGNDDIFKLIPVCNYELNAIVTNATTGEVLAEANVSILDDKNNIISTKKSNGNGEVSYIVECQKNYTIQAIKNGFESNSFTVIASSNKGGSIKIEAALKPISEIITEKEVKLNPIFFEYNNSNITQQGAFELDKLVQIMKNNQKLIIFVKSHTDNRGSDEFNLLLSDKRVKSTIQYLISNGIDPNRISGKGFGETELKVDCKEKCTEDEHEQNRRSEFLIVK